MKSFRVVFWILVICSLAGSPLWGHLHDRYVVFFPQIVRGALANSVYYESFIVVSNPAGEGVDLTINSTLQLPVASLRLSPGETRKITINSETFEMGWVRLEASKTVAAAAHIVVKAASTSTEILSEVTVLGQIPTSKAVLSVSRKAAGSPGESLADNTGIAIAVYQQGLIQLTLRDDGGSVVASRALVACTACPTRTFSYHFARFVTELFPDLPDSFTSGSLLLEHIEPPSIPRAFAVTALYVKGADAWTSAVAPIDTRELYFVRPKSSENIAQQATELAAQYGFTIVPSFPAPTFVISALDEVARAVARDPRVERVSPNTVITLAP